MNTDIHDQYPAGVVDASRYTLRPARREDMHLVHAMLQEIGTLEDRGWTSSLEDRLREFDEDPAPDQNSLLAFDQAGKLVGYSWPEAPDPAAQREHRVFAWVEVHPDQRDRGLGSYLFKWGDQRAAAMLAALPPGLPKMIRYGVSEGLQYYIRLVEEAGYQIVRYFYQMRRDLSIPAGEPALADGIRLVPWSPELDQQTHAVFNRSFLDHWGFEPITYERWQTWFSGHPEFRGDCSFLAMDGEQVAAICVCADRYLDERTPGSQVGWIRDVGTLREYRGRGLATGLMLASLRAFQQKGYTSAGLGVDTENPSGALRIYERLGFRPARTTIMYEKQVTGAGAGASAAG